MARGILLLVLLLAGCAHAQKPVAVHDTQFGKVTGSVTYREKVAFDSTWTVSVTLADVARSDAKGTVVSTQNIKNAHGVPVPFELLYDPSGIDSTHGYAVTATIAQDGRVLWASKMRHAVLTRGAPSHVDIIIQRVAP